MTTQNARQDTAKQTAWEADQNNALAEAELFAPKTSRTRNTFLPRPLAESTYRTCCLCGEPLPREHLYLCSACRA